MTKILRPVLEEVTALMDDVTVTGSRSVVSVCALENKWSWRNELRHNKTLILYMHYFKAANIVVANEMT
jgi:hypothetical protein